MRPKLPALLLAFAAAVTAGANAQTLVEAGGLRATAEDVKAVAERAQQPARRNTYGAPTNVRRQAEEILLRRSFAEQASKAGYERDPIIAAQIRQAREHILSEAWMNRVATAALPDATNITRYATELYKSQPERFRTGEEWQARHILIGPPKSDEAQKKAKDLLAQIKAGAPFDQLARTYSIDKVSATRGGDLGWFGKGAVVPAFQEAVAALPAPGAISDVVETQYGYHIIRLEAKRAAGIRSYDEVKVDLEREVSMALRNAAREKLVQDALPNAKANDLAIEALAREFAAQP